MAPIKTYYAQEIETWVGGSIDSAVTIFVVWQLLGGARRRAASMPTKITVSASPPPRGQSDARHWAELGISQNLQFVKIND